MINIKGLTENNVAKKFEFPNHPTKRDAVKTDLEETLRELGEI